MSKSKQPPDYHFVIKGRLHASKAKSAVNAWELRGVKLRGFKEDVEILSNVDTKITCDRCGKQVFVDDGRVSPCHEFQWVKPFQWFLSCTRNLEKR